MKVHEQTIRDDERKKIGEELHDIVSSELLQLQFLLLKTEPALPSELFAKVMSQTDFIRRQIRSFSHQLVQPEIGHNEQTSLSKVIKNNLLDFVYLHSSLTFNLYLFPKQHLFNLPNSIISELQKVINELLNNSILHGKSTVIECSLTDHPNTVSLIISDNGIGFDLNEITDGIGLSNCRNRLQKLNSTMTIESSLKRGTTININIKKNNR